MKMFFKCLINPLILPVLAFFLLLTPGLQAQKIQRQINPYEKEVRNLIQKELQTLQEEFYWQNSRSAPTKSSSIKNIPAKAAVSATDSAILVNLYNSTDGGNWTNNTNWLTGPVNTWYGVTVENDLVTEIKLKKNNLTGTIPPELGQLASLQYLALDTNQLTGAIPTELGQLTALEYLYLNGNKFTGNIPAELYQLTNLVLLYLSDNQLTGTIPDGLEQLVRLRWLDLSHNEFTGAISDEFGQLSLLQFLDLGQNLITDTIPLSLSQLTNLRWLVLSQNQLSGKIPAELSNLAMLEQLYLDDNQLTDAIPPELGQLANMQWISLEQNNLTGSIPTEIGQMTNLKLLYLNDNQLAGTIPAEIGQAPGLIWVNLSQNQLTGDIPAELWGLTNLNLLYLNNNLLTGTIPAEIGAITGLEWLDLSINEISGAVPEEINQLNSLQFLNLQSNLFSVLPEITLQANLSLVDVSNNNLSFEDLEYNMDLELSIDFFYTPQDSIGTSQTIAKKPGSNFSFAATTGGEQNNYQWYKNDVVLGAQTEANLVIESLAYEDSGKYHCVVTNDLVTGLTLTSRILTLVIDENAETCQKLVFSQGWQIFSAPVTPDSADMKFLFQPLIDNSTLLKIQDETGNALEDWGVTGWRNFIGDIDSGEGYKLRVVEKDSIEICGAPVDYPFPIALKAGWNIIGYPQSTAYNALYLVQPLIDKNNLEKVQDELGNAIEDWGVTGWRNFIGDFTPGKGFKVKLSTPDTLWIQETYPKSARTTTPLPVKTTYFKPMFFANGVDHMNINIAGFPESLFSIGDEIAVFDGELCVGSVKLLPYHIDNRIVSIPISSADEFGMVGFKEGNPFTVKLWSSKQNKLFELNPEIIKGTPTFVKNESTFISLENHATTNLNDEFLFAEAEINCYPNPFSNEITIEFNLNTDAEVEIFIYNHLGQMVTTLLRNKKLNNGVHRVTWDGTAQTGQKTIPGLYYVQLKLDKTIYHRKIVLQ